MSYRPLLMAYYPLLMAYRPGLMSYRPLLMSFYPIPKRDLYPGLLLSNSSYSKDVGERLDGLAFGGHVNVGVLARDGFAVVSDDVSSYGIADPRVL